MTEIPKTRTSVRAVITVSGNVQGVFFRMSARGEAEKLGLVGSAENREDGTVRIVVEGPRDAIDRLLEWCRTGPPLASVKDVAVQWQEATGRFTRFAVQ